MKSEIERWGTRLIVRTFERSQLIDSEAALAQAIQTLGRRPASAASGSEEELLSERADIPPSELFFIELDPPYSHTKKALRQKFDEQRRLVGHDRTWLLNRVVPVLHSGPYVWPDGCPQMKDDFAYMRRTFFGVGLVLDDSAIGLLKSCKPVD